MVYTRVIIKGKDYGIVRLDRIRRFVAVSRTGRGRLVSRLSVNMQGPETLGVRALPASAAKSCSKICNTDLFRQLFVALNLFGLPCITYSPQPWIRLRLSI